MSSSCILEDLDEQYFSRLFSPEWEAGEPLSGILVATLKDYFMDLSIWLGEYYFSKLVYQALNTVVVTYIMMIRRRANGVSGFASENVAATRITNDETAIESFFEDHLQQLQAGGLKVLNSKHKSSAAGPSGNPLLNALLTIS
jgi:hypothetical protein